MRGRLNVRFSGHRGQQGELMAGGQHYESVSFEVEGAVAIVTLNRPEAHNSISETVVSEISDIWARLRMDDSVRAIVLTAAGEKAFCTGIDRSWSPPQPNSPVAINDPLMKLGPKTADLWKPVVAAVNGMACGGAFYFLGESDTIVAADHATFFDPHTTYGLAACFEPILLYGQMPFGELCRIALMGNYERMTAQRAHQIGFVQDVVPAASLLDTAKRIANDLASMPASAVQATLRALWAAREMGRAQAVSMAPHLVSLGNRPEAIEEGLEMFRSGKRIEWRAR